MSAGFFDCVLKTPSLAALIADLAPYGCSGKDDAGNDILIGTPQIAVSFDSDVVQPPDQYDDAGKLTTPGTHLGAYAWIRFAGAAPAEFVVGHTFAAGTQVVAPLDPPYREWA